MDKRIIQYNETMDLIQLMTHHRQGDEVVCNCCGKPLTFVITRQRVAELHMNFGIYCLGHPEHVWITINAH